MAYRVAVVGLGIGQEHLRHWQELPDLFELVAVCDSDQARREQVAGRYSLSAFSSFAALLEADVDIIDICTPPYLHYQMAEAALSAGRHVVCEKPLVNSLAEADALIELEAQTGYRLMPISQYRFSAGIQRLHYLAEQGLTGKPFVASAETHWQRGDAYYAAPWRGRWDTERGGVLLGHALHIHDLLCFVLGDVESVHAAVSTRVNPIETEDCAAVSLRMRSGALVTSSATLGSRQEISRLRFCFEHFSVESSLSPYDPGAEPWHYQFADDATASRIQAALADFEPPSPGYRGQFEGLYAALARGTPLPVSSRDARRALELVTAFYASSRENSAIKLPITASQPGYQDWRPAP